MKNPLKISLPVLITRSDTTDHHHQQLHHPKWERRRRNTANRYFPVHRPHHTNFALANLLLIICVTSLVGDAVVAVASTSSTGGASATSIVGSYVQTAATPKYETAYACEGKTLSIECNSGFMINLIRANYGRFSITICNDHGNTDWSVNCMSPKSLRVLHSKCANRQSCSVLASTNQFGDPCPGTHKYLEAHYLCISAVLQMTTTQKPNPPWLITSQPSVWQTSTIKYSYMPTAATQSSVMGGEIVNSNITEGLTTRVTSAASSSAINNFSNNTFRSSTTTGKPVSSVPSSESVINNKKKFDDEFTIFMTSSTTQSSSVLASNTSHILSINNNNLSNLGAASTTTAASSDAVTTNQLYCPPTTVRNLFWNLTRVGDVNVQPCPGGATGIAKWRCTYEKVASVYGQTPYELGLDETKELDANMMLVRPIWQLETPDLTQCRSLWLNNLEIRVNQKESSLISIANDLSVVTSSKTLYGGDMLVTTKIIQTMSEKMTYDIETFPDQRQREAIVYELLHGVVKTGSNLLDAAQQLSWLDLSFEDQMRVATSLLTGLEDNAFLLADTIIRERNVVQKVKNILLSVRVLETRNIVGNEIFPDSTVEQWPVSDDRIELPRGALIENSEGGLVRIVFVAFDRLESILRPTNSLWSSSTMMSSSSSEQLNNDPIKLNGDGSYDNGAMPAHQLYKHNRILNSKVISASLGKGRHIQLSQPIRLILKHLKVENVSNPICVFWNYIDHAWSEDGCHVEQTNKTHTICSCNHLTNFAILMEIVDLEQLNNLGGMMGRNHHLKSNFNNTILILIYVSIAIFIIFVVVAMFTIKLLNGIFTKSNRTTIYKNLYMCLLAIEILFLIGIELNQTHMLCGFTSAFLHCSFLCAFTWIFFEGFQLYTMLTTDDMLLMDGGEKSSKIIWYYLLTYGLSFTIVSIALLIDPSTYTKASYCVWMEPNNLFYFTFVAPIILFVIATLIYSSMAFYILCKKYKTSLKNKEHTRLANVRVYLRCSIIFLIIFVFVWIFGYIYMMMMTAPLLSSSSSSSSNNLLFGYLFVLLNSIQGIYILVFHCIQNDKVRRDYNKYIRQQTWLPSCLICFAAVGSTNTSATTNTGVGTTNTIVACGGLATSSSPISQNQSATVNQLDTIIITTASNQLSSPAITSTNAVIVNNNNTLRHYNHVHHHQHPQNNVIGGGSSTITAAQHYGAPAGYFTADNRRNIGGHTSPSSSSLSSNHLINYNHNSNQDWNYLQQHQQNNSQTLQSNRKIKKLKSLNNFQRGVGGITAGQSTNDVVAAAASSGFNLEKNSDYFSYWSSTAAAATDQNSSGVLIGIGSGGQNTNKKINRTTSGPVPVVHHHHQNRQQHLEQQHNNYHHQQYDDDEPVYEEILQNRITSNNQPQYFSNHNPHHHHHQSSNYNDYHHHHNSHNPHHNLQLDDDLEWSQQQMILRRQQQHELSSDDADNDDGDYDDDDDDIGIDDEVNELIVDELVGRCDVNGVVVGVPPPPQPNDYMIRDMMIHNHHLNHHQQQPKKKQRHPSSLMLTKKTKPKHSINSGGVVGDILIASLKQQQSNNMTVEQQQHIGRNLSAVLDENNTVICYLEPLPTTTK